MQNGGPAIWWSKYSSCILMIYVVRNGLFMSVAYPYSQNIVILPLGGHMMLKVGLRPISNLVIASPPSGGKPLTGHQHMVVRH